MCFPPFLEDKVLLVQMMISFCPVPTRVGHPDAVNWQLVRAIDAKFRDTFLKSQIRSAENALSDIIEAVMGVPRRGTCYQSISNYVQAMNLVIHRYSEPPHFGAQMYESSSKRKEGIPISPRLRLKDGIMFRIRERHGDGLAQVEVQFSWMVGSSP